MEGLTLSQRRNDNSGDRGHQVTARKNARFLRLARAAARVIADVEQRAELAPSILAMRVAVEDVSRYFKEEEV